VLGVESEGTKPAFLPTKALGESTRDVVYTPVTPCRLVETRGTFAAVYQGDGTPAHTTKPFTSNEIRSYAVQGGNGVCLTQLPGGLNPSAVQLQVFGLPTTPASGDIEILPQGTSFGSTATMEYVGSIAFNTVSTAAKINTANHQISVQVRGGGAHLAIDVVGYFAAPTGTGGKVSCRAAMRSGRWPSSARSTTSRSRSTSTTSDGAWSPTQRVPISLADMRITARTQDRLDRRSRAAARLMTAYAATAPFHAATGHKICLPRSAGASGTWRVATPAW
jgi:hypothetical protein